MNGPGTPPNNPGGTMAKSQPKSPEKNDKRFERQFSQEEMSLGNELMMNLDPVADEQEFMKTVIARAKERGYMIYKNDVPLGTRRYIQYIIRKRTEEATTNDAKIAEALGKTISNEERWFKEVDPHTLHPEDEAELINTLTSNDR